MRILAFTSSYPKFPGDVTAPFIESMVHGTARRGHAVDVVLPRHPDLVTADRAHGLPIDLVPFFAGTRRRFAWGYATSLEADRALRPAAVLVAPLASASALACLLALIARRRYDLVHAHWIVPNGPVAVLAAAAGRLPLVVSVHGSDVFLAERHAGLRPAARWVLGHSRRIIACSRDLAARATALGGASASLQVLPYGVDLPGPEGDGAEWRARLGAREGELLVLGLGRLVAKKGFVHLIRAAGLASERGVPVRVAIGGGGDLAAELAAEGSRGAQNVRLIGAVAHDRVAGFLRAADVVVVPSVVDEEGNVDGLPNVLLEALAAGKPVVASRVGGIPDVIEDRRNGLLVPPADPRAIAAALAELAADAALRGRLAAAAVQTARCRSWDAYVDRLLAIYAEAVAEGVSRAR